MKRDYTIASGTVFYNDCKSLERTLESLKDKVDVMICVDGRFKHYNDGNDSGESNDGSQELVHSYDNAILYSVTNSYEIEKRQCYVDACAFYRDMGADPSQDPDYLLIVDSDEYVYEYDQTTFEKEIEIIRGEPWAQYNVFALMLEINSPNYDHIVHKISGSNAPDLSNNSKKQFAHAPRLWQRPYEMEYNMTHYYFRNKHPSSSLHYQETNAAVKIVQGMKLGHDHNLRNQKFLDARYAYQKHLVDFEQNKLREFVHKHKRNPTIEEYDLIDKGELV